MGQSSEGDADLRAGDQVGEYRVESRLGETQHPRPVAPPPPVDPRPPPVVVVQPPDAAPDAVPPDARPKPHKPPSVDTDLIDPFH